MTEPSKPNKEALRVATSIRNGMAGAAEIDALIAAERQRILRWAEDHYWDSLDAEKWIVLAHLRDGLMCNRPAPDGAAPTKDGDTSRCSTPSQEDTGSVSGTIETAPWCKDAMFVLTTHGDGAATTLHRGWKAICEAVVAVHYFEPDSDQRDEIMARFTDWEIWQNQGGFPWLWHSDYEDGAVTVQRVTGPPTDASGPGSASNTESSPTQTVAVSGEKLWLWKNGDHYLAFAHEYPTYGGGDPMVLGEPAGYALLVRSEPRRTEPPRDVGGLSSASNTDAAQELSGEAIRHLEELIKDGGIGPSDVEDAAKMYPKAASNTESSPTQTAAQERRVPLSEIPGHVLNDCGPVDYRTQTVAPSGPTAGDVERARKQLGPDASRHWICRGYGRVYLDQFVAGIIAAERASARAELLAQIMEPTLHRTVAQFVSENLGYDPKLNWKGAISDEDFPQLVEDICDALVDRLTEAK